MDLIHSSSPKKQGDIYIIAHGFLGNHEDNFCSKMVDFLKKSGLNYCIFDFFGHGKSSGEFANLNQMVQQFIQTYHDILKNYPENNIIPIGFSQGGAIVLKFLATHNQIQKGVLFAPLSIPEMLIARRLSPQEVESLQSGNEFVKDFGQGRNKALNKKWLESYYGFIKVGDLVQIKTKLDIFFAENDKIIHEIQNQFLLSNLTNFTQHQVPNAEHTFNNPENWDFIKIHFPDNAL